VKNKWKRLKFFRQQIIDENENVCVVGKDYGTKGNTAYYYIEINDKVIHHGEIRLKDAKRKTENFILTGKLYK
jgi:hypothetical protein